MNPRFPLIYLLLVVLLAILSGCAIEGNRAAPANAGSDAQGTKYLADVQSAASINRSYFKDFALSVGQDSEDEVFYASSIETRDLAAAPEAQVVMNPKKTKILATVQPSPLAYLSSAENIHFYRRTRNQSLSFGKLVGAVNNYIMGWVTNHGVDATTAQNASNNGVRTAEITAQTQQKAIGAQPVLVPEGVTPVFSPAVR